MTTPVPSAQASRGSNWAQLKDDIDSGETGDKVGGFDPAAAPLGTDEEAGGEVLSPSAIHAARQAEQSAMPSTANANAAEPALQPNAQTGRRPFMVPLLIGVAIAAALVIVAMLAL